MLRLAVLVAIAMASPAQAQVFKCPGPNGQVVYSQTPCSDGKLLDSRKPASPAEQAKQPLTQKREVDRANQPNAGGTEPAPAVIPGGQRTPGSCPDDTEFRNIQTAASSITAQEAEKARRRVHLEAAQRCRANGTSMNTEMVRLEQEAAADEAQRKLIREELRRCHVNVQGNVGFLHCRK